MIKSNKRNFKILLFLFLITSISVLIISSSLSISLARLLIKVENFEDIINITKVNRYLKELFIVKMALQVSNGFISINKVYNSISLFNVFTPLVLLLVNDINKNHFKNKTLALEINLYYILLLSYFLSIMVLLVMVGLNSIKIYAALNYFGYILFIISGLFIVLSILFFLLLFNLMKD